MTYQRAAWEVSVKIAKGLLIASGIAFAVSFPWNVEPQGDKSPSTSQVDFYKRAYGSGVDCPEGNVGLEPLSREQLAYVSVGRQGAVALNIPERASRFVERFGLKDKKILDVGAGSGLLQDVVDDYTALDISPTARRFFHKPFVEASATEMPFPDNSFDGLWSIWVLEHIPNPEAALQEMRRVLKPGSPMLLCPAFDVDRYAAQGYRVRPYSDFDWKGKLIKATIPFTTSNAVFHSLQYHQVRLLRSVGSRLGGGPSRLHFIRLTPNYDHYWEPDSDATTSASFHEIYLWFASRGDLCLSCPSEVTSIFQDARYLCMTVQVRKG